MEEIFFCSIKYYQKQTNNNKYKNHPIFVFSVSKTSLNRDAQFRDENTSVPPSRRATGGKFFWRNLQRQGEI